jgi:protein phosphatase
VTQPEPTREEPAVAAPKEASSGPEGEIRIRSFAKTDVGQIREHNEDNYLVADLTKRVRGLLESNCNGAVGEHGFLFAVCDGMGGAAAGEIASQLAVDVLYEQMATTVVNSRPRTRDELARRLVRSIEEAGQKIFHEAKLDRTRRGMGTTVTAAALMDNFLFLAQVGDSRAYVMRQGELVQVTRDQSLVNQLIEAGQLTEEEAETFEHNNIILQALGTSETVQVDLTFCELHAGDMLLLCSDGLSGMVRSDEIREILRTTPDPAAACATLAERANLAGGHDNITVIVAHFEGERLPVPTDETEALRYRKYPLPECAADQTESHRRTTADEIDPSASPSAPMEVPRGLDSPISLVAPSNRPADPAESAPDVLPTPESDERINIPGTHVPWWVVVALVLGVMATLTAMASFLLR